MRALGVLVVVGLIATRAEAGEPLGGETALRDALHAASVDLASGCSGVLAENKQIVLTAKHCVDRADRSVGLRFSNGESRLGWIVATDPVADQAVLFVEDPVPIEPLAVVRRRQVPGTVLYFEGRPSHPRFQQARLDRIGACPSLPGLPNALFTSIQGTPGDSGAPLVDAAGRVVGLVHGGARCHIATPSDTLSRLLDRVLEREAPQAAAVPHDVIPSRRIFA